MIDYVASQISGDGYWKEYWIGLNDRQSEDTFVWESGRSLSAEIAGKWKSGMENGKEWNEPDDEYGDQDCTRIVYHAMSDAGCHKTIRFVCQKSS